MAPWTPLQVAQLPSPGACIGLAFSSRQAFPHGLEEELCLLIWSREETPRAELSTQLLFFLRYLQLFMTLSNICILVSMPQISYCFFKTLHLHVQSMVSMRL